MQTKCKGGKILMHTALKSCAPAACAPSAGGVGGAKEPASHRAAAFAAAAFAAFAAAAAVAAAAAGDAAADKAANGADAGVAGGLGGGGGGTRWMAKAKESGKACQRNWCCRSGRLPQLLRCQYLYFCTSKASKLWYLPHESIPPTPA